MYVAKKSVKSVSLSVEIKELTLGDSFRLSTTVSPSDAANVVVYSSDQSNVAKVSSEGEVTAVLPGTARITATTVDGRKKAVCTVTVKETANTENKTTESGTTESGTTKLETTETGTTESGTTKPETTEQGTTESGTTQPETTETGTTESGATNPEKPENPTEIISNLSNPTVENGIVYYSCVYFGNYPQSDGTGVNKEPIKWRVLSVKGTDAFLIADSLLDSQQYNDTYTSVTWEKCTLRSWLNGYGSDSNNSGIDYSNNNFIDTAFTPEEQNAIMTT